MMEPEEIQSKVDLLKAAAPQSDNSEVQIRVQKLIELIRQCLRSQNLNAKTQKELARLLSIAPNLKNHHVQQLDLLDLAVSLLIEASETEDIQPTDGLGAWKRKPKNLVFVQETRRQIDRQSRTYPAVHRAMFTGNGTPYIRLISGLSWFFLIFVLLPSLLAGIAIGIRGGAREIAQFEEAIEKAREIEGKEAEFETIQETITSENQRLKDRNTRLIASLSTTKSKLSNLAEQTTETTTANSAEDVRDQNAIALGVLEEIEQDINATLQDDSPIASIPESPDANGTTLQDKDRIPPSPRRRSQNSGSLAPLEEASDPANPRADDEKKVSERIRDLSTDAITTADNLVNDQFALISLAIAMGALGSTISVIVRADTFIKQAQESDNDLFLTGFFRPFVGMSFAIFCVALVETGIFSGIFDINDREDNDQTYFYVAIAFVAGFSERLVRDVVIKTEDTLAGPKPRD